MKENTDIRWLLVGAVVGLVAAGYGILRQVDPVSGLPDDAIAVVNGIPIGRDVYEREIERRPGSGGDARAAVIDSLVDDELLVQRGVALGMTSTDLTVRSAVINSLVASVTAEADAASPDDEALEQYLADNRERFSFTAKLHVEAWQTDLEPVARSFSTALRDTGTVALNDDIAAMPDLPAGLVDIAMIRNYLGPAITAAAADMPPGSSALFARRGRWIVIRVVERQREAVTDLAAVRSRVLLDYRRSLADDRLREYLGGLRERAEILIPAP